MPRKDPKQWDPRLFRIEPQPGYTPHIGALVKMMNYTRFTTLEAVKNLNTEQLDARPVGFDNSIGMLLAHMAAVERLYHRLSFKGRGFDDEDMALYGGAMSMGKEGERVQGRPLQTYLDDLKAARAITLEKFAQLDDAWLASSLTVPDFDYANHHWAWFHVMEDEVSHRGQIRVLRKALVANTAG